MFDPYGKVTVLDGNGTPRTVNQSAYGNPWTFGGRRLDQETGLMYFRARMYSPDLGRFVGRDPIGYVDGYGMYSAYFVPGGVDPYGLEVTHEEAGGDWPGFIWKDLENRVGALMDGKIGDDGGPTGGLFGGSHMSTPNPNTPGQTKFIPYKQKNVRFNCSAEDPTFSITRLCGCWSCRLENIDYSGLLVSYWMKGHAEAKTHEWHHQIILLSGHYSLRENQESFLKDHVAFAHTEQEARDKLQKFIDQTNEEAKERYGKIMGFSSDYDGFLGSRVTAIDNDLVQQLAVKARDIGRAPFKPADDFCIPRYGK